MKRNSCRSFSRRWLAGALAAAALVACKSASEPDVSTPTPRPVELTNEFDATAKVVAIAAADRVLTLRREDGAQIDVQVGDAVRNFGQIAVGDDVRVRYREQLVVTRRDRGERLGPIEGAIAAGRAAPGEKPGAGVGMAVSVNVRIESIDLAHDVVVFALGSGELLARRLRTDAGRDFARTLSVGDVVRLDFAEALALTVEEV